MLAVTVLINLSKESGIHAPFDNWGATTSEGTFLPRIIEYKTPYCLTLSKLLPVKLLPCKNIINGHFFVLSFSYSLGVHIKALYT